jgi:1,5-anhydro-D-fructose reductase (1,5-anhydro-D-mannitol-forming)
MLSWVVVGIGDISLRRVIPAIQAESRSYLYGIVTRDPAKAVQFRATHVWTSLEEALSDPAVQCVYIATPVFLHAPQTIASLRAGKHVLCEKPMAMNVGEARAMLQAAQDNAKLLGVAYYRRMYPKVMRAKELLDSGAIGQPVLAELTCHAWFDGTGPRSWLVDPTKAGGGPLFDIASHRIDLLNFLFGEPQLVTGRVSNVVHRYPVEDNATVIVEYEAGVRGIVDVRWHSKITRDECRIRGTDGEIDLTPLNEPQLVYPGGCEHLPAHENLHYPMVRNFVDGVLEGAALLASGESSVWTNWVIEQAADGGRNPAIKRRALS